MPQNIDICGIANERTANNKISDGSDAAGRPNHARQVVVGQRENPISQSREKYLPRCPRKGWRTRLPLFRKHRPEGPAQRTTEQGDRPPKLASAQSCG